MTACANHKYLEIGLRIVFGAALSALTGLAGLYLYCNATYASAAEVNQLRNNMTEMRKEIRQDLREGFDRIEKRLK